MNRRTRICSPLHNHSATRPVTGSKHTAHDVMCGGLKRQNPANGVLAGNPVDWIAGETGAGNETRTRDPDLGKVVLYQLSYSRKNYSKSGVP